MAHHPGGHHGLPLVGGRPVQLADGRYADRHASDPAAAGPRPAATGARADRRGVERLIRAAPATDRIATPFSAQRWALILAKSAEQNLNCHFERSEESCFITTT